MPNAKVFTHAFSGGEVTPELYARGDVAHVTQSLAVCRNCETLPHGPVRNRAGFEFVKEVGDETHPAKLISFSFNAQQSFAIELGAGYIRWHALAETLLAGSPVAYDNAHAYVAGDLASSGGVNYYCILASTGNVPPNGTYWYAMPVDGTLQIPSPYTAGELFDIHYTQSADVVTLVHPNHPVMELRRLGATTWTLTAVAFVATVLPPTAMTAVATGAGATSYSYVATAVSSTNNLEESTAAVTPATCANDLTIAGQFNTVGCTPPAGALRINYFKFAGGLYGYIGQGAPGSGFIDNNITPDISRTPPLFDATFNVGAGNYPGAVGYFEQRRVFAGWNNSPQSVETTRTGTESNISYHIPTIADDRIAFRIAARQGSQIHHVVPVQDLILLTGTNAFRVMPGDGGPLTGANENVRAQGVGSNNVQPATLDTTVLYAQATGGRIRELAYSLTNYGSYYQSNDLSQLAPHLFDYMTVVDMALALTPFPILWVINDAGALLGCTYVPQQQISAWHRHDTDGLFESCCVVTEEGEDYLYAEISRTIGGVTRRYIERKHSRQMPTQADAFFLDSGLTYSGAPTDTITSGLAHLEGKTVSILADGAVLAQQVVAGGGLPATLAAPASTIHVGLPITADIQTLPLVIGLPDFGQGTEKNLNNVWLRVKDSSGIYVGPDFDNLVPFKQRTTEPYGSPPNWKQGWAQVMPLAKWSEDGQVCIRQSDPLPLTVVAIKVEVAIGG